MICYVFHPCRVARNVKKRAYSEPRFSTPGRFFDDCSAEGLRVSFHSGTVTWNGTLIGFTPGENPVVGDAELRVSMSNLSGQADFTGLEQWTAGTAPGGAGSGTMWGDGDLSYRLDITGNRFRDQAGSLDDGRLTGAFVGYSHEGAAGTLERGDLTAAFGASR